MEGHHRSAEAAAHDCDVISTFNFVIHNDLNLKRD
jgi:hypothetical protein